MGGTQSKHFSMDGIKEIRKQASLLMGDISETLLMNTKQLAFMKVYSSLDETDHKQRFRKMKHRKSKMCPCLLNLLRIQQSQNNQLCGVAYKLYCFYECYEQDLQCVYNERVLQKERFNEQQLLEMALSIIKGLIFIQDNELKRCHLSKKSVIYVGSTIKLLDQLIVQRLHPYYLLLNHEPLEDDIFMSPELIRELARSNLDPYISAKSDIFTLGMLLLHLASLESLGSYYDYELFTIDVESVHAKIQRIRYSNTFKRLLDLMLDCNEQTRPGIVTLQERLESMTKQSLNTSTKKYMNLKLDTEPDSLSLVRNRGKTSRSSINLINTYADLDTVKMSDDHLPVMLRIPFNKASVGQVPTITINTAVAGTSFNGQVRSITDYSNIVNRLHKHNTFQLEDETDNQTLPQQNLGNTAVSIGYSPIKKINYLMDTTLRESTENIQSNKYGRLIYPRGHYYDGELQNGEPYGNGILYFPSGKVFYSGSWQNNKFHGFGTLHNQQPIQTYAPIDYQNFDAIDRYWLRYEGEFKNDNRSGFGSIYFTSGEKFSGCFKHNKADGYGTFYSKSGGHLNGVWRQNRFLH